VNIDLLLKELVSNVEGATGAILVEADGEAVSWHSLSNESDQLRLRGAYVAVVMRGFRAFASKASLGHLEHMIIDYEGAKLIVQEIDLDCWVVLELKPFVSVGRGLRRMQTAAEKFRLELTT
jgi:predicted regulator of Ras-like GTPase activity (Roadblock/LC7/MglB family)